MFCLIGCPRWLHSIVQIVCRQGVALVGSLLEGLVEVAGKGLRVVFWYCVCFGALDRGDLWRSQACGVDWP